MRTHARVMLFVLAASFYGAATSALADASLALAEPKLEVVPKSLSNGLYFAAGFTASWANGSVTVFLTGPIDNTSTTRTSGTLQLQLWAVASPPARAGSFSGYRLARSQNYNPLPPQTQYNNVSFTAPFAPPPNGTYWLLLSLAEHDSVACAGLADLFCINEDSINSNTTSTFGVGQLQVPVAFSFADQPVGTQSAPITRSVTNIGGLPVTISSVTSTDLTDFPASSNCVTTIQPGGQCTVTISSAPSTAGFHSATVTIASDGLGNPQSFTVSGSGIAAVGQLQMPSSITFAGQPVGTQSAPITRTVTNIGGLPVTVSSVTSTDLTDFPASTNCVTTIQPGGQCTVTFSSAPSTAGFHSATVVIASNGVGSPQSFTVSGSGIAAPGQLQMPSSITFADQPVGTQSPSKILTITNIGGTAVTVSSVTGSDLTQFPGTSTCVTTLQPGGQCNVTLSFEPSTVGLHGDVVTLNSNGLGSPQSFTVSGTGITSSGTANSPGPLSGLWWNPNESGWGIAFTQRRNIVFAAWYTYDSAGNPKWYVASNCTMPSGVTGTSGTCSGSLYEVNGPTYFGATFNPSLVNVTTVGSLTVSFLNANAATMSYTVNGQNRTVSIVRQVFQSGTTLPAVDYTDLWWNPSESGWGIEITHQYGVMFLAWYVYDASGQPVWYVAPDCVVIGSGCLGTVYSTRGPAFGPSFDPSRIQVFTAGTIAVNFSDANHGTLSYTINGVSASKTITRQVF